MEERPFCPACGNYLASGATYCAQCGRPVDNIPEGAENVAEPQNQNYQYPGIVVNEEFLKELSEKRMRLVLTLLLVHGILFTIVGLVLLFDRPLIDDLSNGNGMVSWFLGVIGLSPNRLADMPDAFLWFYPLTGIFALATAAVCVKRTSYIMAIVTAGISFFTCINTVVPFLYMLLTYWMVCGSRYAFNNKK